MKKNDISSYYDKVALKRKKWKKFNRFYYKQLTKHIRFIIPEGSNVLEIGCGTGELLHSLKPAKGTGIDFSEKMIAMARKQFPSYDFYVQDAEASALNKKFDYILLSDLVNISWDVQQIFTHVYQMCHPHTRVVVNYYNSSWEYIIRFLEAIGFKQKQPLHNWLSVGDLENILDLENFELVKKERKLLIPKYIPIIHGIFNKFLANLPLVNKLDLVNIVVARPIISNKGTYSVSIVVPARNEKGNIENAILRTPKFGLWQEFVFVEGHSSDGTWDEILRIKEKFETTHKIIAFKQSGKGKGNAVREAFDRASGDVLMILDADLTTPPEQMDKFFNALENNKGEFINGCRLVYPMEKEAMRFLNLMGNKFFGFFFTFLLGQRLKDTLCGTKVLLKSDYEKIKANRHYFGDFDPFGDFDLLFGAAKLNLKITEVIIRYKDREYGSTQISRFKHGWLLIKMSFFAAFKFKFR
jgi:ubiquinone/menaquinone biosynthesis C-methylase UbiE